MFSKVYSAGLNGIDGYLVQVEADASSGLPGFSMVGVLASEVKEAQDRVRTALRNSDYRLPSRKVTVNLSPAGIRKGGTGFDLPIAVAVLAAFEIVKTETLTRAVLAGELGLDGRVKPVRGILSIVSAARDAGMERCFLPLENVMEGRAIPGIEIIGVRNIREMVALLEHPEQIRGEFYLSLIHILSPVKKQMRLSVRLSTSSLVSYPVSSEQLATTSIKVSAYRMHWHASAANVRLLF